MVGFKIITVAQKMPEWVTLGFLEYQKRFSHDFSCELIEIPIKKRNKSSVIEKLVAEESKMIQAACAKGSSTFALDVLGQNFSSEQLSKQLAKVMQNTSHINFVIGGPDGLSREFLQTADIRWSLSPLTLPHGLVRIILAEQLYRATSILKHHPYHRA